MADDGSPISRPPANGLRVEANGKEDAERLTAFDFRDPFAAAAREGHMPMVITDALATDHPVIFANPAFCRMTGYSIEEILGQNCRFLQGPETDPVAVAKIAAAVHAERPIEIELRNYRKDGSVFWNRLFIAPVHNADGEVAYFFSNQLDITGEHERVAELQFQNEALNEFASLLADRTAELVDTNEKLQTEVMERARMEATIRQLHKMEALGQLTGGIAHDFNNLLGNIIGVLELMQHAISAGRVDAMERYVTAASVSAGRAASLTQRLLMFARQNPLMPQRTDLNQVVAGMEDLLRRTLGPTIELDFFLVKGPSVGLCDPNLLENAILNLAINARDAMPAGGRLTIASGNAIIRERVFGLNGVDLEPGRYVTVSVTDSGVGINPSVMARVFEPFFTTKPIGEGTGLGLSMVHDFAAQSGGHVVARSKPGRGSTFKIYLPVYRESVPEKVVKAAAAPIARTPSAKDQTILVVEDDETFQMIVSETLGDLGYKTVTATNGLSALEIVHADGPIDLVITDIGLPGLDGRELAKAIHKARPALPVLFVTGFDSEIMSDNSLPSSDGTVKMLTKPFSLLTLRQQVQEMLGSH